MKTLSLKSSVKITRILLVTAALLAPLAASAGTRQPVSSLEHASQPAAISRAQQASTKWSAFLSAGASVTPKTVAFVNGWTLPDNPVVGQGYPIKWQGYIYSSSPNYIMLFAKPPGSSTWNPCGSGGVPPGGGFVYASGGFYISAPGTWYFGVAPGGSTPTSASASLNVP
jgi:hypothetical protein